MWHTRGTKHPPDVECPAVFVFVCEANNKRQVL